MIPDPVALGELAEKGNEEVQVFFEEEMDLMLSRCEPCWSTRLRFFVRLWCRKLLGDCILEDSAAVVPDCVVFWVLAKEFRSKSKGCRAVVFLVDLMDISSCNRTLYRYVPTFSRTSSTSFWYASILLNSF